MGSKKISPKHKAQYAFTKLQESRSKRAVFPIQNAFRHRYDKKELLSVNIKAFIHLITRLNSPHLSSLISGPPSNIEQQLEAKDVQADFEANWFKIYSEATRIFPNWAAIFLLEVSSQIFADRIVELPPGSPGRDCSVLGRYLETAFSIEDLAHAFPDPSELEPHRLNGQASIKSQRFDLKTEINSCLLPPCKNPSNPITQGTASASYGFPPTQSCGSGEMVPVTRNRDIFQVPLPETLAEYRPTELNLAEAAGFTITPEADNMSTQYRPATELDLFSLGLEVEASAVSSNIFIDLDVANAACFVIPSRASVVEMSLQNNPASGHWGLPMDEKDVTSDVTFCFNGGRPGNTNGHPD